MIGACIIILWNDGMMQKYMVRLWCGAFIIIWWNGNKAHALYLSEMVIRCKHGHICVLHIYTGAFIT